MDHATEGTSGSPTATPSEQLTGLGKLQTEKNDREQSYYPKVIKVRSVK